MTDKKKNNDDTPLSPLLPLSSSWFMQPHFWKRYQCVPDKARGGGGGGGGKATLLGKGGYGCVYLVRDVLCNNVLRVVKILMKLSKRRGKGLSRTCEHTIYNNTLKHIPQCVNHVMATYDYAIVPSIQALHRTKKLYVTSPPHFYAIVCEYVRGESLKTLSETLDDNMVPPALAQQIIVQCLRTLKYLHYHGVVHRDIKPDNIVVHISDDHSKTLTVKYIDFGLAKLFHNRNHTDTSGSDNDDDDDFDHDINMYKNIGTPLYMSPSLVLAGNTLPRYHCAAEWMQNDVWGLGATFFEMLTGHRFVNKETITTFDILRSFHGNLLTPDTTSPLLQYMLNYHMKLYNHISKQHSRHTRDLVENMLQPRGNYRIDAAHALRYVRKHI